MLLVSAPLLAVSTSPGVALGMVDVVGVAVWTVGFLFEAVGDWQLLQFKRKRAEPAAIMTQGLWKYTRHPNYFGEALLWWGMFLIGLGSPHGWWALVSPVLLTFLLLRVSGVSMLEKKYDGSTEYGRYKARTNAFLPWLPRKEAKEV
jgi:steroid 5-alpha reductase family enzyme